MKKVYFYDPHSYQDDEHLLTVGEHRYHLQLLRPGEVAVDPVWVFIMDEHCVSKLPFYYPRNRRVAILKESPVHTRKLDPNVLKKNFDLILTHREDLIEQGSPFHRVDFSTNWAMLDQQSLSGIEKTKRVSFVGSLQHPDVHGYEFRRAVAEALSAEEGVDLFGRGIRPIEHKTEGLVPYCFSVALENCVENFYYTEKIIDCFFCETVPLYWGCPSIHEIFDSRGMITFRSIPELMNIVANLSFETYREMLPYVRENRDRCIRYKLASYDDYLTRCVEVAKEVLGESLHPLRKYQVSKPVAGLRMIADRLRKPFVRSAINHQVVPC